MPKVLQFDVETSYRQHNNLFEVTEIRCLVIKFVIHEIYVMHTPLKSAFHGLQFRRGQYASIFIRLAVIAPETREMLRNSKKI